MSPHRVISGYHADKRNRREPEVGDDPGGRDRANPQSLFHRRASIRAIARHYRHGRRVIRRAIASAEPPEYQRQAPKTAPVLGPYQSRIDELLAESERQPRKQRYTARRIFHMLQDEGYRGSESTVRRYVSTQRQTQRQPEAFLPLEFDPGRDSQVDWGESQVVVGEEPVTAQVFVIRLNYSKARFAIAYPHQQQDAFVKTPKFVPFKSGKSGWVFSSSKSIRRSAT